MKRLLPPRMSDDGHAHIVTAMPEPEVVIINEAGRPWTEEEWDAVARHAAEYEHQHGPTRWTFHGETPHDGWRLRAFPQRAVIGDLGEEP